MATIEHDVLPEQSEDAGLLHGHHASTSYLLDDNASHDRAASTHSYSPSYRDNFPTADKGLGYYSADTVVESHDRPYDSDPSSYELATKHKEDEDFGVHLLLNIHSSKLF